MCDYLWGCHAKVCTITIPSRLAAGAASPAILIRSAERVTRASDANTIIRSARLELTMTRAALIGVVAGRARCPALACGIARARWASKVVVGWGPVVTSSG